MFEKAEELLLHSEDKMEKSVQSLVKEFQTIRTGRANPALLDRLVIDYYGVETPVRQISGISVADGNQLVIKPFDKSTLKPIEKAILASDLGLTPANDGVVIRLTLPQLTEARRKELVKDVEKIGEAAKVHVRNIRRDVNDALKKLSLAEDVEKDFLTEVQSLTDKFIKKVEEEIKVKSLEITKI